MPLFSHRQGIRPMQKAVQRESMDDDLRNKLWSATMISVWDHWSPRDFFGHQPDDARRVEQIVRLIWLSYFREPIDTVPEFHGRSGSAYDILRQRFFKSEWWEVYDFLESLVKLSGEPWSRDLVGFVNQFLEEENAAYRIVDQEVVEITDEHEIAAIESAIGRADRSVREHLQRALELLSDRKQPDYRNSVKEAISAVEAMCRAVSGKPKGTLGDCLKVLKSKTTIHSALESAFSKLYGYASDEGGIRHALAEESEQPSFADAKFMLVACSAFTNFLWTKAAESGMALPKSG